jgi:hypothetical protein
MKLLSIVIISILALTQAAGQEKTIPLETPFSLLKVSGNIHLELVSSDTQQLILLSEEKPEDMEVKVQGEQLNLKTKSELSKSQAIEVKLHYVNLSGLEVTKGGRVQSGDTLIAEVLKLDVLTGGKTELWVRTDSLIARVNQGSDIILYGSTRSQFINAYTWGNYLAPELEASDAYVKAASGAQVKVYCSRLLDANATSNGFIGYWGNPDQKREKTSVGGEITPLAE